MRGQPDRVATGSDTRSDAQDRAVPEDAQLAHAGAIIPSASVSAEPGSQESIGCLPARAGNASTADDPIVFVEPSNQAAARRTAAHQPGGLSDDQTKRPAIAVVANDDVDRPVGDAGVDESNAGLAELQCNRLAQFGRVGSRGDDVQRDGSHSGERGVLAGQGLSLGSARQAEHGGGNRENAHTGSSGKESSNVGPDVGPVRESVSTPAPDPKTPALGLPAETPAELLRNAGSILASASIGNRHSRTFATVDVLRARQLIASAVALLEPAARPIVVEGFGR